MKASSAEPRTRYRVKCSHTCLSLRTVSIIGTDRGALSLLVSIERHGRASKGYLVIYKTKQGSVTALV